MPYHICFLALACIIGFVSSSDVGDLGINAFAASRSLLEVKSSPADPPSVNGTVYNVNNCTIIYTRGLSLKYMTTVDKKNVAVSLIDLTPYTPKVSGKCDNASKGTGASTVTVDYEMKSGNVTSFTMNFFFNASASGKWELQKLTVSLKCSTGTPHCPTITDMPFVTSNIASERGFSYHCSQPPLIKPANTTKPVNLFLSFKKLQIQPFNIEKGRFSHADDCIGFFSAGVWSGLFVSLLLTLILAYGIIMISNISVSDRFDDPKGPGIQVNVQE